MCLGFSEYEAALAAEAEKQRAASAAATAAKNLEDAVMADGTRHDVSCDGIQVGIWEMPSNRVCVTTRVPIRSESMAFFMLPAPRACLGEHMLPSPEVACVQSVLEGWMAPEQYVPVPKTRDTSRDPRYRSMSGGGGGGGGGEQAHVPPPFTLPPAACLVNADGSTVFTLPTAEVPPTTPVTDPGVRTAILDSLKGGMAAADFDATRIFGPPATTDPDDAAAKIETDFLDELYPNFRSGCDMLVCLPPQDGGKGGKGAHTAFSFTFVYEIDDVVTLPLLGLVHNFDPSATDDKEQQTVEENYYVFTNSPRLTLQLTGGAFIGAKTLPLHAAHDFLPKCLPKECVSKTWRELDMEGIHHERYYFDYGKWMLDCSAFQETAKMKILTQVLDPAARTLKEPFAPSVAHANAAASLMAGPRPGFSATNLIGRRVNDGVVTVDAQFFNIKDTDSAHAVKTRMKESKGWPAPAPLSPIPPAPPSEGEDWDGA